MSPNIGADSVPANGFWIHATTCDSWPTSTELQKAAKRQENGVRARIAAAHFPTIKTIESFDFTLQPKLPKSPPGVGKSHILSALGLAMCMRGHRVLFTTAAALLMKRIAAKKIATLERHYRNLDRIDLLLIDELAHVPFEREATDLLFQLISQRYERRSIVLTTNLPFEKWTQIFPDEMAATEVIDRLVHHGEVFAFSGQSHRLRTRGKSSKSA